jgi:hypothetical protein
MEEGGLVPIEIATGTDELMQIAGSGLDDQEKVLTAETPVRAAQPRDLLVREARQFEVVRNP